MSITLRHIEVFRAIMTTGSMTAAAAMLHTSQPTVSRELARLEYLTQLTLFERVHGRLRPTAQALQLFEEVQRAYFGLERIVSTADALRQFDQGQLSIACLPVFSQSLLPQACKIFLAQFPKVSISITPQESPLLEEWLSAQRHDIGLTEVDNAPPGTVLSRLMSVDEVCVLPDGHPLAARSALAPRDFAGQPFISLAAVDPYRQQIDEIFRGAGIERRMALDTHSAASVCAMVREGVGLAIVNPLTALDFAGQGLQMRRFTVSLPFTVNIVKPLHRPLSQLVELLEKALQEHAASVQRRLLDL
ncbi:LysR family transcriptional regulator [Janthinobacterium agaricidamnosum]|uniref:Transcriptional activator protein lysR n=1 Tax=Janthinobacterium agaricidamnosum NBRC 102515 = DSM 9628 TaxID=1349767 RepID=W0V3J6_9BURK|nr:LysR family transcriptional regulator [Janthinobacterium agaricidamnosum]CDG82180.1 transcriptional activator protein lysR [Janthinobacterium agaricidamnosum NBRC 102515 = DSM 9628]